MAIIPSGATATVRSDIGGLLPQAAPQAFAGAGLAIMPPFARDRKRGVGDRLPSKMALRTAPAGSLIVAPGAPAGRTNTSFESFTYQCVTRKLAESVAVESQIDYGENFDAKLAVAGLKTRELMVDHNSRVLTKALDATALPLSGTTGLNVSTAWTNQASSTPVTDVGTGIDAILKKTGMMPNLLVIGYAAWRALSGNNQIMETYGGKYGGEAPRQANGFMRLEAIAAALGVARVAVDLMVVDTAAANLPVAGGYQWPAAQAGLYLVADSEGEYPTAKPTFGRTVYWSKFKGLLTVREWMDPDGESDIIEVGQSTDELVLNYDCAFRFGNVA